MYDLSPKDVQRFWSKVDRKKSNSCWPWIAKARHWFGYGLFKVNIAGLPGGRNVPASRLACFLVHGAPPEGKPYALHSCDNPGCCNPAHLRWGSQADNVDDAVLRGRNSPPPVNAHYRDKSNQPRGERAGGAKLTEPLVREIWRLHFEDRPISEMAETLKVPFHGAYDACRGKTWRHLENAPSIESLKAAGAARGFNQFSNGGDTRALSPKSKIPSSEIPAILARCAAGETMESIGRSYGVQKAAISKIRQKALG